jgi:hypothetical protein
MAEIREFSAVINSPKDIENKRNQKAIQKD